MSSFKKEEKFIIDFISELTKESPETKKHNINLYTNLFKNMDDKEFTIFMEKLRDGDILNLIVDVDPSKSNISIDHCLNMAEKYDYPLFQKIYIKGDNKDIPDSIPTYDALILCLPFRRAKQTVEKGVSVSYDSKHFDILTGQPTGVSASSKISNPEAQILLGRGLKETATELMIDRSDQQRSNILISGIKKYGKIPDEIVDTYGDKTRTTQTLKAYLNGMHLNMNL